MIDFESQKLVMDFGDHGALGAGMDKATHDRIREICTQIGTIMEDASVVALVWKIDDSLSDPDRLHQIRHAHAEIGRLLEAATNLLR